MKKITFLAAFIGMLSFANAQTPLAQFKFEENTDNSGSDANYGANLQPEGSTIVYDYSEGAAIEGYASIDFDGSYYFNLLDPTTAKNMDALTISAWVRPTADMLASGFHSIFEKDGNFRLGIENEDTDDDGTLDGARFHFVVATENLGWYDLGNLKSSVEVKADEWVNVVAVYYGSKKFLIYVNGVLDAEVDVAAYLEIDNLGKTLGTANAITMADHGYKGLMDDLQFFNIGLDATQVKALYDSYGLGVAKFDISDKINLYPNPASSRISLENIERNSTVEIFSITGQSIFTTISKTNKISVDIRDLNAGVYFVKVENETSKGVKKLIISN